MRSCALSCLIVATAVFAAGCATRYDTILYPPPPASAYPMPQGYGSYGPNGAYEYPSSAPGYYPGYYPPPAGPAPPGTHSPQQAATAVAFARSRLATPYCWGGNGPHCYDCSGLTWASWQAAGKSIPRTSEAQLAKLTPVPMDRLQPGDILWRPGHVGLYVGDGWAIHAPQTGGVVRYQEALKYQRAVRP